MTTDITLEPLTPTQQVRLELRAHNGRYLTLALLCERTGLTPAQVQSALQVLTKQFRIVRRVPQWKSNTDRVPQAYAWNDRRDDHG